MIAFVYFVILLETNVCVCIYTSILVLLSKDIK